MNRVRAAFEAPEGYVARPNKKPGRVSAPGELLRS
jgi:hypothetical protein